MDEKLKELKKIYQILEEARINNIPGFSEMNEDFKQKLKNYLKETFGDAINFGEEDTLLHVNAQYNGVSITIFTFPGITLKIEGPSMPDVVNSFTPIFESIVGLPLACSYTYCSDCHKDTSSMYEWNTQPTQALEGVINSYCGDGYYIKDFIDYYTQNLILELGEQLLTFEGYKTLFPVYPELQKYWWHKFRQIQKVRPDIKDEELHAWVETSKNTLKLEQMKFN